MGVERPPDQAVTRIFVVTAGGAILWILASFLFVILR
jgi:hypothetical protein